MIAPGRKQATILIIDDDVTNLKVAAEPLRADGVEILTARDGTTGINRAQLAQPDLIILDVQMPGIDGFETCRRLKADQRTKDIPIIMFSANKDVEKIAKEAGADGFLAKPFEMKDLLSVVSTYTSTA